MNFEWVEIDFIEDAEIRTWRAKVIGGWLVRTECWDKDMGQSESMVFLPDLKHEWEIK